MSVLKCLNGANRKLNNKGSALVSVLVVTAFITIIGTTMLYISAQNYQMKQTDYQNKQSFYEAEKAIDSLKALLVEDVQKAYLAAYKDTMNNYLKLVTSKDRKEYYQQCYLDNLQEIWDDRIGGGDKTTAVKNYMITKGLSAEADCIYKVEGYGIASTTVTDPVTGEEKTEKQFVINGVRAKFTSGAYTNFLYTDICLALPELDLTVDKSAEVIGGTPAPTSTQRETIALTDYVVYMNWRKADYYE